MATYTEVKQKIQQWITSNANREVTAQVMRDMLNFLSDWIQLDNFVFIYKCLTGFTFAELSQITDLQLSIVQTFKCKDDSRIRNWKYVPNDTSTENGGTVVVTSTGKRIIAIYEKGVFRLSQFGCISDFNDTTKTGTDCTNFVQNCINQLNIDGGGEIVWDGEYLVNGTIYVNPSNAKTKMSFRGIGDGYKLDGYGKQSRIIRQNGGDIIRVNLKSDGTAFFSDTFGELTAFYNGFSFSGIYGQRKAKVDNTNDDTIVMLKVFGTTAGTLHNTGSSGFAYVMLQPEKDANNKQTYCDQWSIKNICAHYSTQGCLELQFADNTIIERVTLEDPKQGNAKGVLVKNSTSISIDGVLYWRPNTSTTTAVANSSFVELENCQASTIKGIHVERCINEATVKLTSCNQVDVENIHTRYYSKKAIFLNNNDGINIKKWHSWEDRSTDEHDIWGYANNTNVILENFYFKNYTGGAQRSTIVTGTEVVIKNQNKQITAPDSDFTIKKEQYGTIVLLGNTTAQRSVDFENSTFSTAELTIITRASKWNSAKTFVAGSDVSISSFETDSIYRVQICRRDDGGISYRLLSFTKQIAFIRDIVSLTSGKFELINTAIKASTIPMVSLVTEVGSSNTKWYRGRIDSTNPNKMIIEAMKSDGSVNTSDTSVIAYHLVRQ